MVRPVCQPDLGQVADVREAIHCDRRDVETFEELLTRWRDAETGGDRAAVAGLLATGFRGDGPDGRVLTAPDWLGHTPAGAFRWTRLQQSPGVGVATGHRDGAACTVVAERRDGRWQIVNVQRGS